MSNIQLIDERSVDQFNKNHFKTINHIMNMTSLDNSYDCCPKQSNKTTIITLVLKLPALPVYDDNGEGR